MEEKIYEAVKEPLENENITLVGVHFGKESYIMLIVWVAIGLVFYTRQRKFFTGKN